MGRKELTLSGFQALVLLLFNNVDLGETLSYEQIKAETGLPDPDLKRTLLSLASAKVRPLVKQPKGSEVHDTDVFRINVKFQHAKIKVKVNQIQLKETKEENKATHEQVALDREFETQAAIVRIMKSKKTIAHNLLVAEVIEATKRRGVLSPPDIKNQIDKYVVSSFPPFFYLLS